MPFYENDLSCSKIIAVANGVPEERVHVVAATKDNLRAMNGTVDVIYSHVSYGFHYPTSTYAAEAFVAFKPGGLMLLTLRHGQGVKLPANAEGQRVTTTVDSMEAVTTLQAAGFLCHTRPKEPYSCEDKCRIYRCLKPRDKHK